MEHLKITTSPGYLAAKMAARVPFGKFAYGLAADAAYKHLPYLRKDPVGLTRRMLQWKDNVLPVDIAMLEKESDRLFLQAGKNTNEHCKRAMEYCNSFQKGNFFTFFNNLSPSEKKSSEAKDMYYHKMFALRMIGQKLTEEEKGDLLFALRLHDIEKKPSGVERGHEEKGANTVFALMNEMRFTDRASRAASELVGRHMQALNLGVDVFPDELNSLSSAMKDQIFIMAIADLAANRKGNLLSYGTASDLISLYFSGAQFPDHSLYKFRLRTFLTPYRFANQKNGNCTAAEMRVMEEAADPVMVKALNETIKISNFPFFQSLALTGNRIPRFIKLVKMICYTADKISRGGYVNVHNSEDVFLMDTNRKMTLALRFGMILDDVPDDFTPDEVWEELNRNSFKSCFGLPMNITPEKIVLMDPANPLHIA